MNLERVRIFWHVYLQQIEFEIEIKKKIRTNKQRICIILLVNKFEDLTASGN